MNFKTAEKTFYDSQNVNKVLKIAIHLLVALLINLVYRRLSYIKNKISVFKLTVLN